MNRMNKDYFRIISMKSSVTDLDYWMSVSWEERLSALEDLRQQLFNYDDKTPPRLQRVYSITQQTRS